MKIMKIVYMQECEHSDWDGGNSRPYMGEESWQVGEKFKGEFTQGSVTEIYKRQNGDVMVEVDGRIAMTIAPPPMQFKEFTMEKNKSLINL